MFLAGKVESGIPKAAVPVSPKRTSWGCRKAARVGQRWDWVTSRAEMSSSWGRGGRVGIGAEGTWEGSIWEIIEARRGFRGAGEKVVPLTVVVKALR